MPLLAFFWLVLRGFIFLHNFIFDLLCHLKCDFCVQHTIVGLCFLYTVLSLGLLTQVFRPFVFNMVINMVWFKSVILRFVPCFSFHICPICILLFTHSSLITCDSIFSSFNGSLAITLCFVILVVVLGFIVYIFNFLPLTFK